MTREEAKEILEELWRYQRTYKYTDMQIREALITAIVELELPTQKTGKWISQSIHMPLSDDFKDCVMCNCCGSHYDYGFKYCPSCGARMEV